MAAVCPHQRVLAAVDILVGEQAKHSAYLLSRIPCVGENVVLISDVACMISKLVCPLLRDLVVPIIPCSLAIFGFQFCFDCIVISHHHILGSRVPLRLRPCLVVPLLSRILVLSCGLFHRCLPASLFPCGLAVSPCVFATSLLLCHGLRPFAWLPCFCFGSLWFAVSALPCGLVAEWFLVALWFPCTLAALLLPCFVLVRGFRAALRPRY